MDAQAGERLGRGGLLLGDDVDLAGRALAPDARPGPAGCRCAAARAPRRGDDDLAPVDQRVAAGVRACRCGLPPATGAAASERRAPASTSAPRRDGAHGDGSDVAHLGGRSRRGGPPRPGRRSSAGRPRRAARCPRCRPGSCAPPRASARSPRPAAPAAPRSGRARPGSSAAARAPAGRAASRSTSRRRRRRARTRAPPRPAADRSRAPPRAAGGGADRRFGGRWCARQRGAAPARSPRTAPPRPRARPCRRCAATATSGRSCSSSAPRSPATASAAARAARARAPRSASPAARRASARSAGSRRRARGPPAPPPAACRRRRTPTASRSIAYSRGCCRSPCFGAGRPQPVSLPILQLRGGDAVLWPGSRAACARALCSCDFEVPTWQPRIAAISSCSSPSTSWRTMTVR